MKYLQHLIWLHILLVVLFIFTSCGEAETPSKWTDLTNFRSTGQITYTDPEIITRYLSQFGLDYADVDVTQVHRKEYCISEYHTLTLGLNSDTDESYSLLDRELYAGKRYSLTSPEDKLSHIAAASHGCTYLTRTNAPDSLSRDALNQAVGYDINSSMRIEMNVDLDSTIDNPLSVDFYPLFERSWVGTPEGECWVDLPAGIIAVVYET